MPSDIVVASDLIAYLNNKEPSAQTELVRVGVNALIERYCCRVFAADTTNRTETYRTTEAYQRVVQLKKPPVVAFTSLQTGEAGSLRLVDGTSYEVLEEEGMIRMIGSFFLAETRYTATYKGGYTTIPEDLKLVGLSIMAREIEKSSKGRHGMRGRAIQGGSVELVEENLTTFEKAILDGYVLERMD